MLRVTPQPLPLALVRLISASRLAHPFALSPPALASAQRGFLQARSLVSARLATHRLLVSRTTRDVSEPVSATLYLTTSTRASWALDSSRALLRARAERGSNAFSRRLLRFGGSPGCLTWGAFSSPACPMFPQGNHEPCDRASDTSVASPLLRWRFRTHRVFKNAKTAFAVPS